MKIVFSNENTRKVFADRDIHEFSQLMYETAKGVTRDGHSKEQCNDEIRKVFYDVFRLRRAVPAKSCAVLSVDIKQTSSRLSRRP